MNTSIRIVIAALGGEGGGVLGKWIADMAARLGYLSQTTSVPGVAQRTGATIYYIEIFPREQAQAAGLNPVMSMFPTPGDVDIVICSEIVEAGRMIQRGFVTPQRTTLVSSTHRTYGITEKEAMGDGVVDKEAIADVARASAQTFVGFDMLETARRFDSVINAALFGALAETGVLPFEREEFEETIRQGKIAVESNLRTFEASFEQARLQRSGGVQYVEPEVQSEPAFQLPQSPSAEGAALLNRVASFPEPAREMIYLGVRKLVEYQDGQYANLYLDRLDSLQDCEQAGSAELTCEMARFLALWMAFEDLARVAQIKISPERFERFRQEVKAGDEQQVGMVEFLHPRVEEFCGVMPARLGRYMLNSPLFSRVLGWFARPRNIRTNSVHGYLFFYLMAWCRRFRPASLSYQIEQDHILQWLNVVGQASQKDYDLAVELTRCGRLIKGYGATRERGTNSVQKIIGLFHELSGLPAQSVAALREAALADDQGIALATAEQELRAAH